jgi:hypothetical protein
MQINRNRARRIGVGLAAAGSLLVLVPAAQAKPRIPHYTAYTYKAKLSIKGGAHQDQSIAPDANTPQGEVVNEHVVGSYSIDAHFQDVFFVVRGKLKAPHVTNAPKAVVNGTWTNQGQTWNSVTKTTESYTCSGGIDSSVPGAGAEMRWRKRGSGLHFTVEALQTLLKVNGERSCPGNAFYLSQVDMPAYITEFSIPRGSIGNKTIVKSVSGPLAENRPPSDDCAYLSGATCTFNTTWQGVVRLTRVRKLKL